jgi:hypothetical protein
VNWREQGKALTEGTALAARTRSSESQEFQKRSSPKQCLTICAGSLIRRPFLSKTFGSEVPGWILISRRPIARSGAFLP